MKQVISSLLCGFIFALGLAISGMTEPVKIVGFLDIFGNWDPSLIFVMLGAVTTYSVYYWLFFKNSIRGEQYCNNSTNKKIDRKLLFGSSLFGIGWAISGLCPGPGLTALSSLTPYAFSFVSALVIGMLAHKIFAKKCL